MAHVSVPQLTVNYRKILSPVRTHGTLNSSDICGWRLAAQFGQLNGSVLQVFAVRREQRLNRDGVGQSGPRRDPL